MGSVFDDWPGPGGWNGKFGDPTSDVPGMFGIERFCPDDFVAVSAPHPVSHLHNAVYGLRVGMGNA